MLHSWSPQWKRLLAMAMITFFLVLVVSFGSPLLNSQRRHLQSVERHLSRITPAWGRFQAEHRGLSEVKLFAYTGGDGMLGAQGYVVSEEDAAHLRRFIESTGPPRPVFYGWLHVAGSEAVEALRNARDQTKSEPVAGPISR